MTTKQAKSDLIANIIVRIATHGAFQRNRIYCKKLSRKQDREFKSFLKDVLNSTLTEIVSSPKYSDNDHYKTIINLSNKLSTKFSSCLREGRINIGTTQKILNLYWKMVWVFQKNIPPPIHCPFDGIIIRRLNKSVRQLRWTKIDDINDYKLLVAAAREKSNGNNLGEWELVEYNDGNFINDALND